MFRFPPLLPFTKKLMITLAATFVAAVVLTRVAGIPVVELLALLPQPGIHTAWQLFTYPLVGVPSSGGVISLLISLLFLWLMMSPFEARFGGTITLQMCVVATLVSGLVYIPAALVLPAHPLLGPSPLFLGVIGAYAASMPRGAQLSFFGVIPMTPKVLVLIFLGLSALMNLADGNFAAIFADAAAIFAGIGFVRWWLARPVRPRTPKAEKKKKNGGRRKRPSGWQVIEGGGEGDDDDDDRPRYLN